MRRLGGGAGYDLDSIVTFLPTKKGRVAALVADVAAGRGLLASSPPGSSNPSAAATAWSPRGTSPPPSRPPASNDLGSFLDLTAEHLAAQGFEVRRLPILAVPVAMLQDHEGLAHSAFLITWNNVVVERKETSAPRASPLCSPPETSSPATPSPRSGPASTSSRRWCAASS